MSEHDGRIPESETQPVGWGEVFEGNDHGALLPNHAEAFL